MHWIRCREVAIKIIVLIIVIAGALIYDSSLNIANSWTSIGNYKYTDCDAGISIDVVGFSGQSSKITTSQLLEVKTEGYAENAYLQYTYTNKSMSECFDLTPNITPLSPVYNYLMTYENPDTWNYSGIDVMDNLLGASVGFTETFATKTGNNHVVGDNEDGALETVMTTNKFCAMSYMMETVYSTTDNIIIEVKDINPDSGTYGKTATIRIDYLREASIGNDIDDGMGAMFIGEELEVRQLIARAGAPYRKPDLTGTSIDDFEMKTTFSGLNVEEELEYYGKLQLIVTNAWYYFTATKSGLAKCYLETNHGVDVSHVFYSSERIITNPSPEDGTLEFYVFARKPTVKTYGYMIEVSNTIKGVTYTIGEQSITATSDYQTLTFGGEDSVFLGDQDYQLEVSYAINGKTARVFVDVYNEPPEFVTVNFDYNGVEKVSGLSSIEIYYNTTINGRNDDVTGLGYEFLSWNTQADGSGINMSDNAQTVLKDNITLYAQWEVLDYTTTVCVTEDAEALEGAEVALYQNQTAIYVLEETSTAGTYQNTEVHYQRGSGGSDTYDVYVDGVDSGQDITWTGMEAEGDEQTCTVYAFTIRVDLQYNESPWLGQLVSVTKDGTTKWLSYDETSGKYEYRVLYKTDQPNDGVYDVAINYATMYRNNSKVSITITSDVTSNEVDIDYYDITVKVNKDGSSWSGATVKLQKNGVNYYALTYDTTEQSYIVEGVLDDGSDYDVYISGSDSSADIGEVVDFDNREISVDYYTLNFVDSDNTATIFSQQILLEGDNAKKPYNPAVEGKTFSYWATSEDGTSDAFANGSVGASITSATTYYAQWVLPSVIIGQYVTYGSGDSKYYKMDNITIQGFPDEEDSVPIITMKIEPKAYETVITYTGNNDKVNAEYDANGALLISVSGGCSMSEAVSILKDVTIEPVFQESGTHECKVSVFGMTS